MNLHIDNDTCHEIIFTQGGVSHSLDKLYYNEHLVWEKQSQHDYSQDYFTIESLEDNNSITLAPIDSAPSITFYYSTDDGTTWSTHGESSSKEWVLNSGDKLLLKANTTKLSNYTTGSWHIISTKTHNVYGNIMSLLYGDNFAGQTSFPANSTYTFNSLFYNNAYLLNANNLILPATTLVEYCYRSMFEACTSLITTPTLNAMTMAQGCYMSMFKGCSALQEAPELPATTLTHSCYYVMFYECTSLVKAPELPASTAAIWCYYAMFQGCTSLNYIKCLATDISVTDCTLNWVNGVSATGEFVKDSSMTSWTTGTSGIPSGWTVNDYVA